MRDGWRQTTLGEVADTLLGKTLARGGSSVEGGRPYLRNVNVQWGRVSDQSLNEMNFSDVEQQLYELKAGDVLVCEGGEVGRLALLKEDLPGIYFQNALHRVRASAGDEPGFIALALEHLVRTGGLEGLVRQVTIAHLNQRTLRQLPITVPPIPEQRRIVNLIASVDDAVDAAEAEGAASTAALVAERARAFGRPTESLSAGMAFDVAIGKQRSAEKVDGANVIPYLRSANVDLGCIRVKDVLAMHFSEREAERLCLRDGDVLITEGSASAIAVGVPAVWRGEIDGAVGIQNALIRVRAVPELSTPEFAEHWAFWAYESGTFREIANGTNIKHIGVERAKLVRVPRVDVAEQPALVAHMSTLRDSAKAARTTADALRSLRGNLLTLLLSGEHEIPSSYDALLEEVT